MSQKPENEGVFSRWSRRKLDTKEGIKTGDKVVEPEFPPIRESSSIDQAQKLEDESPLPLWQQPDASPSEKKSALSALFRQPEFHEVDRMNEYDEDFTQFDGLGSIVTQEMKRMLKLAEEKTRPDEVIADTEIDDKKQDSRLTEIKSSRSELENDNKDNEIA